ncbi:hypothetical protein Pres01_46680 [Metapseudomonas resinovorans]|uniref:hypothetical protein n=1 Tax=Metapseudomonas resinovorans TaxID=53412 RepID=UPI0009858C6C|nr:hypothetical protein [Pseudomonas resinovorans]GLZ88617.1 hypothetical protein Pres01_46680 [Pseudomonas resinovorans]
MRAKLEQRLQKRLEASLPGHVINCKIGADGIVALTVHWPASGESMAITGITMQSLIGRDVLEVTVDQILIEISAARGELPLLLTQRKAE